MVQTAIVVPDASLATLDPLLREKGDTDVWCPSATLGSKISKVSTSGHARRTWRGGSACRKEISRLIRLP